MENAMTASKILCPCGHPVAQHQANMKTGTIRCRCRF
jgi:hypothetical protein